MKSFIKLPRPLKRIAFTTAWMAPRVKRHLRRHRYDATKEWLNRRRQPLIDDLSEAFMIARIAQIVTARLPGEYNCLTRSLLVWWLVGGDPSALVKLGVTQKDDNSGYLFHAWVEKDGAVINDAEDIGTRYTQFAGPPSSTMSFD